MPTEPKPERILLDTNELRREERTEKALYARAKAEAKVAKQEAKQLAVMAKVLKAQVRRNKADRALQLAAKGQRRGLFGRVVHVRQSKTGAIDYYRAAPTHSHGRGRPAPETKSEE